MRKTKTGWRQTSRSQRARWRLHAQPWYPRAAILPVRRCVRLHPGWFWTFAPRPGERPGTDGILDLGEIDRMQAEVEIYQTRIGEVSVGDR